MRFKKKKGFKYSKRATTMFYSPLIYFASLILLIYLLIFINQKRSLFQNRQLGQEAINMLLTQQEAEKSRIYVQESANLALRQGIADFLENGGHKHIIGVYSEADDTPLSENFLSLFREDLQKYLNASPYLLTDNYILKLNTSKGVKVVGISGYKKSFIMGSPVPSDLLWPVDTYNGYYLITDSTGCYGKIINKVTKREDFSTGINAKPPSGRGNVYSIAKNGRVTLVNGNSVAINYTTFVAVYSNLIKVNVKLGQTVDKGTKIGEISRLPPDNYLFFQIVIGNKNINPLCYYPIDNLYYSDNTKADCRVSCEGGLYTVDTSFKTSDDFQLEQMINFYNKIRGIKDYCLNELNFKDCVDNNISQLKSYYPDIKEINNGDACEEGVKEGFVTFSLSLQKCYYTRDNNCYCEIDLNQLLPNTRETYYINIMNVSDKTGLLLFDSKSNLIKEIKLNFSSNLMENNQRLNLNTHQLSIRVFNNREPVVLYDKSKANRQILSVLKDGNKLLFLSPDDESMITTNNLNKCTQNDDLILLCYKGMKLEVSRKNALPKLNIK